jgi:hypothetical protein
MNENFAPRKSGHLIEHPRIVNDDSTVSRCRNLPPSAVAPKTTVSEEQDNDDDNQN